MKSWKIVLTVLLNLVAVTVPVSALYAKYGIDERVRAGAVDQLFSLAGAMLAGFGIAFIAGNVIKKADTGYSQVLTTAIQALNVRNKAA